MSLPALGITCFSVSIGVVSLSSRLNSTITSTNLDNKSGSTTSIIGIDLKNKTFLNSDIEIIKAKNKNGNPILYGNDLDSNSQNEVLVGELYLKKLGIKDVKNVVNKTIKLNLEIPNKKAFSLSLKVKGVISKLYTLESKNMNDTEKIASKIKSKGIMKALGASKKNIKSVFLVQSASLGFLGGLLGFIIYLIAYTSLDKYLVNMIYKKGSPSINSFLVFNPTFILIAILLATIISIIAGLIPSSKAAKLDPVETLSYE